MTRWMSNLLGGAATVLQFSPPPVRRQFGRTILDRSVNDAFRRDAENLARDMRAAVTAVYGGVGYAETGPQPDARPAAGVGHADEVAAAG